MRQNFCPGLQQALLPDSTQKAPVSSVLSMQSWLVWHVLQPAVVSLKVPQRVLPSTSRRQEQLAFPLQVTSGPTQASEVIVGQAAEFAQRLREVSQTCPSGQQSCVHARSTGRQTQEPSRQLRPSPQAVPSGFLPLHLPRRLTRQNGHGLFFRFFFLEAVSTAESPTAPNDRALSRIAVWRRVNPRPSIIASASKCFPSMTALRL
jgi:hypothetical protein